MISTRFGPIAVQQTSDGPPGTTPVVLLHGGGPGCHAATDFRLILRHLPPRPIYLVDLPGYGRTPLRASPPSQRFGAYAEEVSAVLDDVGIDRCDFVTQSLGGIVALVFAAENPDRVGRIVTIGSQPLAAPEGMRADPELAARARRAYYGGGCPDSDALVREILSLEWLDSSRIPAELIADRYAASVTADSLAIATDPTLLGQPEDLTSALESVQAPTLMIRGSDDPFAEPAYAAWLAGRLARGRSAIVADAAHHPQSQKPEETAQLIRAHLLSPE